METFIRYKTWEEVKESNVYGIRDDPCTDCVSSEELSSIKVLPYSRTGTESPVLVTGPCLVETPIGFS